MNNDQPIESAPPKVVVKKVVNAEREKIFDAWTIPSLMQQWFFPPGGKASSSNDLRVGGSYRHDMIIKGTDKSCDGVGTSLEDGYTCYPHYGEYVELRRPDRIVFTWNSPAVKNTRVTVDLRELGSSTEVTITHELLDTEAQRKSHNQGWGECLNSLEAFFGSSGDTVANA